MLRAARVGDVRWGAGNGEGGAQLAAKLCLDDDLQVLARHGGVVQAHVAVVRPPYRENLPAGGRIVDVLLQVLLLVALLGRRVLHDLLVALLVALLVGLFLCLLRRLLVVCSAVLGKA